MYTEYERVESDYVSGELHPGDLKAGLTDAINAYVNSACTVHCMSALCTHSLARLAIATCSPLAVPLTLCASTLRSLR